MASGPRSVRYLSGFGSGCHFGVHTNSLENLTRGIVERVFYVVRDGELKPAPKPKADVFSRLSSIRTRLLRATRPTPIVEREDYPALYVGRKRGVYQRALDSLSVRGVNSKDAYVSTFVKAEKINFTAKPDPPPRVIQPRSPRYNLEVGRYLKLFEAELCKGFCRVFGYDVILKGKNADGVGEALAANWGAFRYPVALGLDATRFDQHVSYEALQWEHSVYNSVFNSKDLAKLLKWQLINRGIARVPGHRVDYTIRGCRMSGDINTGMGNCLLMSSMVLSYCEHIGVKVRLANNGDDCVLFMESEDLPRVQAGISSWMLDYGFTLTFDEPVFELERVIFCQSQPVQLSTGWRMVRDPRIAMSKDCISLLSWDDETSFGIWARAIGDCGMQLTSGVPVWHAWYKRLVDIGGPHRDGAAEYIRDSGLGYMARGVLSGAVDARARVSFYKAFGILPDLQEALELEYSSSAVIDTCRPMISEETQYLDINENSLASWLKLRQ